MENPQEAFFLWVPGNVESQEEWDSRATQATAANGAVIDFCDGIIRLDDCFQIVEANDVDIDQYIENFKDVVGEFGA